MAIELSLIRFYRLPSLGRKMGWIMQSLLVIEVDPEVRRHVHEALEEAGYRVLTAADAHEGLRLFRAQPVDLVLVELHIPGMDGLDLVRMLRSTCHRAKLIAITRGIFDWEYLAVYRGAHMTLQKPFSRKTLLEAVRTQLQS